MAKKSKASTNVTVSAKELKFWLHGILEFQNKDWVPSAEQWKSIKDKIFSLDDLPAASQPLYSLTPSVFGPPQPALLPNGGAPVSVPSIFSETPQHQPNSFGGGAPTVIAPPPVMPVRDANGFLVMPNEINP